MMTPVHLQSFSVLLSTSPLILAVTYRAMSSVYFIFSFLASCNHPPSPSPPSPKKKVLPFPPKKNTLPLRKNNPPSHLPPQKENVCLVSALNVVLCVVVMSRPQPTLSGTGVLWVSTETGVLIHPPEQSGVNQQCVSSCIVWNMVAVHSDVVIFKKPLG